MSYSALREKAEGWSWRAPSPQVASAGKRRRSREQWSMSEVPRQRRRALRFCEVEWSQELVDPRQARGKRYEHCGLLGLLVAAFACGLKSLRRVEDLAEDLGGRVRKRLGLPGKVSDTTLWNLLAKQTTQGLGQTVATQVRRLLKQPWLTKVALVLERETEPAKG